MKSVSDRFSVLVGIGVSAFLIGCGNQISDNVRGAVIDNRDAKSLLEWEQSDSNPEHLFQEWREQVKGDPTQLEKIEKQVCQGLRSLDGQSLSIFENEIRDDENEDLLRSCREELLRNLEVYFSSERSKLNVATNALVLRRSKNNFRFPVNTQHRDVSKGYYAVSGDIARKEIILTFDDGPSPLYTRSILQSLKEVGAKAHFFNLGKNVRANPEIVKLVASEGHAIGSHTNSHTCIGTSKSCLKHNGRIFTFNEAVEEIKSGHQALFDVLGWADPFFRFPYGENSQDLKKFLGNKSTAEFAWNLESEDWRAQPTERYINNILTQLDVKGRGILLMHDIQRRTAEALPQLLQELYSRGYSVVLLQAADPAAKRNSKLVKAALP